MKKYTSEHLDQLEQRLPEYLMAVNPGTFSWSNENDVDKLVEWLENKDSVASNPTHLSNEQLDEIWNKAPMCLCGTDIYWSQDIAGDIFCENCDEPVYKEETDKLEDRTYEYLFLVVQLFDGKSLVHTSFNARHMNLAEAEAKAKEHFSKFQVYTATAVAINQQGEVFTLIQHSKKVN